MSHALRKNQTRRDARVEARTTAEKLDYLRNAADISGRSLSDFMIESAYEKAETIIKNNQTMILSRRDSEIFVNALRNPGKPNQKLLNAIEDYKKNVICK